MKWVRKCGRWVQKHPDVRKGLILACVVIAVNLSAVACGTEEYSLSSNALSTDESTRSAVSTAERTERTESGAQQADSSIRGDSNSSATGAGSAASKEGAASIAAETLVETAAASQMAESAPGGSSGSEAIYVYVTGAVEQPGVYSFPPGARIYEAAEAAGGLTAEAAGEYVNQASPLYDGEQVYFPTRAETQVESEAGQKGSIPVAAEAGYTRSGGDPAAAGTPSGAGSIVTEDQSQGAGSAAKGTGKVNINTADLQGLQQIPGIGEKKAASILAYRDAHGAFSSIEEIMQVSGIKEGTFAKIRDSITVDGS